MNNLAFEWKESTSLVDELHKPIERVSVEFESRGFPIFVTLWRPDGTGLRINSEMHDVAERIEVGVLCFRIVFSPESNSQIVDITSPFDGEIIVSKLIIHESGVTAESGIVLTSVREKNDVVIVAGVNPYCMAIRGVLTSTPHIIEPEYPIDHYECIHIG